MKLILKVILCTIILNFALWVQNFDSERRIQSIRSDTAKKVLINQEPIIIYRIDGEILHFRESEIPQNRR